MSKRFTVHQSGSGRWIVTDTQPPHSKGLPGPHRVIVAEISQTRALRRAMTLNEAHETNMHRKGS
jgi:hypothetical protein